jgi:hypothetical protein
MVLLALLVFIVAPVVRRRRQQARKQEQEAANPSEPEVPPNSDLNPSGVDDTQPVDRDPVHITETLDGGASISGPSTSQMATVHWQPVTNRPLPVPTRPLPSAPPSIHTIASSPTLDSFPPSNHDITTESTHLIPEEVQYIHSLYSQDMPHEEIVDVMRLMRAERGTGSNPRLGDEIEEVDVDPACDVVT